MAGGAHSALLRAPQVKTHQQRHQKDAQQPHGLGSQESDGRAAADFAGPTGLVPNPAVKTHVTGTPPEYQNPCSLLLPCGWPRKHPATGRKPAPEGHAVSDPVYMKRPEQANPERQRVDLGLSGTGGGGNNGDCGVSRQVTKMLKTRYWRRWPTL